MSPRKSYWLRSWLPTAHRTPASRRPLAVERLEPRDVPTAVPPPSGMVAWWTGDNTGGDLVGGNDATLISGATFADGHVRRALSFDGVNNRAEVGDVAALKLTGSLTIEAWVRVDSWPTRPHGHILFRGDDRNGLDPYFLGVNQQGQLKFVIGGLTERSLIEGGSLPLGEFAHVAATLDDATGAQRIYINGVLAVETITTVRPFRDLDPAFNPSVAIGNHGGYPNSPHNYPLHGRIDDLAVYDRALTAEEIQGIYNAGVDGKIKPIKFFVVNDASSNNTYEYSSIGNTGGTTSLDATNSAPRGAASTAAGDTVWVVDGNTTNKKVYVYSSAGALLGSWTPGSLASNAIVEGITVWGNDVWLVDARQDRVFKYVGAATRLSGSQNAASIGSGSFNLNSGNSSPKDLVTDGTSIWVVNDTLSTDKVFRYGLTGTPVVSWTISGGGGSPTGITLDPSAPVHLWVVDNATDRVYQYDNAVGRTSGSQSASTTFALAAGNTNPQGIADPPVPSGGIAGAWRPAGPPSPGIAADWLTDDEFDFRPIAVDLPRVKVGRR